MQRARGNQAKASVVGLILIVLLSGCGGGSGSDVESQESHTASATDAPPKHTPSPEATPFSDFFGGNGENWTFQQYCLSASDVSAALGDQYTATLNGGLTDGHFCSYTTTDRTGYVIEIGSTTTPPSGDLSTLFWLGGLVFTQEPTVEPAPSLGSGAQFASSPTACATVVPAANFPEDRPYAQVEVFTTDDEPLPAALCTWDLVRFLGLFGAQLQ